MTTPTMRALLPKELITPLKLLGKYDWLTWWPSDTTPPSTSYRTAIPDEPCLREHSLFLQRLRMIGRMEGGALIRMYAYSKTLASGPKLLQPTAEQCEALRHVDVNVSLGEYEQPFASFIVELPMEFRKTMTEAFSWPCARFVVNYHDRRTGYLLSFCERGPSEPGSFNVISPRPEFATIEHALQYTAEQDGDDLRQGAVLQRIACNFGLLLTRFGVRDHGPPDPNRLAKQTRQGRSGNARKAGKAQALADAAISRIAFQQDVVFFDEIKGSERSEPTGQKKRTHWRRGHFRRQRHGIGLSERRLVFIRPMLINAEHFHGDLADTEYRISIPQSASKEKSHA